MATKDVLEALAAGAGRQSAIGGLMFQDAQKREAQGYELALQKEKWRRAGETSALENAMKGYKANWESYTKTFNKLNEIYWRAKSGQASENFDLTTTDLTELNNERLKYWDLSQHSKKKFLEYSGITYDPESMPTSGPGGVTETEAAATDPIVETVVDQYKKQELDLINSQMEKGKDWGSSDAVESANDLLVRAGKLKLQAEGKNIEEYSIELLHEMYDMTPKQEEDFRKKMLAAVQPRARRAAGQVSLDEGSYPQGEAAYWAGDPAARRTDLEARLEATGTPTPNYSDPAGIRDPLFIGKAEDRAVKREQEKGAISKADFGRSYKEAQIALTEIMTQTGTITKAQFMALVKQTGVKGIELMAYRQAYKDLIGKKPTGLGFESGGLQERIDAGGSVPSLSNILSP